VRLTRIDFVASGTDILHAGIKTSKAKCIERFLRYSEHVSFPCQSAWECDKADKNTSKSFVEVLRKT